jgi:hypothetical protein
MNFLCQLLCISNIVSPYFYILLYVIIVIMGQNKIRSAEGYFSAIRVEIKRDNIMHAAFEALHSYRFELKRDIKVIFISEQGMQV